MKFNFKVYRAKNGKDAAYVPADKRILVYEADIEADNGNAAWRMLDEQIDIKRRWYVKITVVA